MALSFNYGSKHNRREIQSAYNSCLKLGILHYIIDIDFLQNYLRSDLLKTGGDIPEGHYQEKIMKKTVVPFRNGIMLSIACGIAESNNLSSVMIGNHLGDHAIYPDCRKSFIIPMANAMMNGTYSNIKLESPFLYLSKEDIVRLGEKENVPFEDSYSCYRGEAIHCGRCSTCFERREAFYLTGIPDRTIYLDETPVGELINEYKSLLSENGGIDGAVKEDCLEDNG